MTTLAQKNALAAHRRRTAERGLVRVEVRVPQESAKLIRDIASGLRDDPTVGHRVEEALKGSPSQSGRRGTWAEIIATLPDVSGREFDDAFDQPRIAIEFRDTEP